MSVSTISCQDVLLPLRMLKVLSDLIGKHLCWESSNAPCETLRGEKVIGISSTVMEQTLVCLAIHDIGECYLKSV